MDDRMNERRRIDPLPSEDECVTVDHCSKISTMILSENRRPLARKLGINEQKIQEIETSCKLNQFSDSEIVFEILNEWRRNKGREATKDSLRKALQEIRRQDIVDEILKEPGSSSTNRTIEEIQILICDEHRRLYQRLKLPQAPWMKKILPLEELYVDLEMLKTQREDGDSEGVEIKLQELFDKIDGEDPLRILIEGGPGFGKTTLGLKLLNDWGRNRDYIGSKFKLVFLIPLRYYKESDSIEELLKRECSTVDVHVHEVIQCIRTFESETLLILDGFDEMNEECKRKFLSLIQKKEFPSMFVVVTSRRGMCHLEKRNEAPYAGIVCELKEDEDLIPQWNKRIFIKGITEDKIEIFMKKYFDKTLEEVKATILPLTAHISSKIMECPLFLILIATMLEDKKLEKVDSKTSLYKEFFNFIIRRSLIREKRINEDQKVDLFNDSLNDSVTESLVQFGRLAIDYLCEDELMLEEEKILEHCGDEVVLHLGFLVKLTKFQNHQTNDFYQPIHKSFIEFVAAFAMWKTCNDDQEHFKREMERIGNKGLKPTDDSLFYVFLGGLMNVKAHVLFQCLIPYYLSFNVTNICFQNILLEIQDICSLFPSSESLMEPFIPSVYLFVKYHDTDFVDSRIHSLILKYASDRQLIKYFLCNCRFSFSSPQEFYIETLELSVDEDFSNCFRNESKYFIRCKNFLCTIFKGFKEDNWKYFLKLMNSIESETYYFEFRRPSVSFLCLKEMTEGQWKEKNIDGLNLKVKGDDVDSVSLLVDLVKKNRIKEGIRLEIIKESLITEEKKNLFKRKTQELINEIVNCKNILDFHLYLIEYLYQFDFVGLNKRNWRSLTINRSCSSFLDSVKKKRKKISVEKVDTDFDVEDLHLIDGIKWLRCHSHIFDFFIKRNCLDLKQIQILKLKCNIKKEIELIPKLCSQLINLQVLSLNVHYIETRPSDSRDSFVNLFSSLNLRICEFLGLSCIELFCFFPEVVMEGLKKKKEKGKRSNVDEDNFTIKSKEENKVQLQELIINFHSLGDYNQLKNCKIFDGIRSMLRDHRLGKFSLLSYYHFNIYYYFKYSKDFEYFLLSLFPLNEKFKITRELYGLDAIFTDVKLTNYLRGIINIKYKYFVQFIGD